MLGLPEESGAQRPLPAELCTVQLAASKCKLRLLSLQKHCKELCSACQESIGHDARGHNHQQAAQACGTSNCFLLLYRVHYVLPATYIISTRLSPDLQPIYQQTICRQAHCYFVHCPATTATHPYPLHLVQVVQADWQYTSCSPRCRIYENQEEQKVVPCRRAEQGQLSASSRRHLLAIFIKCFTHGPALVRSILPAMNTPWLFAHPDATVVLLA